MQTLTVQLAERSYPILIGSGLLDAPTVLAGQIPPGDVLLVSNVIVAPLYAQRLRQALGGRRIVEVVLPDGEAHKTLASANRIFDVLIANRFGRDAVIVALGGGVIGDLAGFAAACYQRGIAFVQVPTTLLADVDSSVGGKTAVNHPGGKNMIGAFHQPRAVLIDTGLLSTLPIRELRAGLAEVIKYGLIWDAAFFEWIEAHLEQVLDRESSALVHLIHRSCAIKAEIVSRDGEREMQPAHALVRRDLAARQMQRLRGGPTQERQQHAARPAVESPHSRVAHQRRKPKRLLVEAPGSREIVDIDSRFEHSADSWRRIGHRILLTTYRARCGPRRTCGFDPTGG